MLIHFCFSYSSLWAKWIQSWASWQMELWTTWYTGQNSLATKIITMATVKRIRYEDSVVQHNRPTERKVFLILWQRYFIFWTPNMCTEILMMSTILCLWLRTSLIYINNCPTWCNTKQSIYNSASSLYIFRVSITPIIRSIQNCNYSLRCWSYFVQLLPSNVGKLLATLERGSCTKISRVPEAVVTVLCTPDDECGWHPKYVEWTCRIVNKL